MWLVILIIGVLALGILTSFHPRGRRFYRHHYSRAHRYVRERYSRYRRY